MICRDNTKSRLIIDSRKLIFRIIVVNRVPEYLVHKLSNIRVCVRVNFTSRLAAIVITRQKILYSNPKQKGINPHIYGINGMVNYGVCTLTVYLYLEFRIIILLVMRIRSTVLDVVLSHDM